MSEQNWQHDYLDLHAMYTDLLAQMHAKDEKILFLCNALRKAEIAMWESESNMDIYAADAAAALIACEANQ